MAGALVLLGCAPAFAGVLWRLDSSSAPRIRRLAVRPIIATASNLEDTEVVGDGASVTLTTGCPAIFCFYGRAAGAIEAKLEAPEGTERQELSALPDRRTRRRRRDWETTVMTQPLARCTELKIVIPVELEGERPRGSRKP